MQESDFKTAPETRRSLVARLGEAMRRHPKIILAVQWGVASTYLLLLLVPLVLPLPDENARIFNHLQRFAQFLFWGIGWPLIMLSMMLFGRLWCGIFCPDGMLTEVVSRHGRHGSIPRWIRWPGWPCLMLVATTVYGQLVGVYDFHPATLLLLGLPTLGALLTGYLFGNGQRIWCMYLCPANGVFALLARIAPWHFRVDDDKWKNFSGRTFRLECPPLLDVRRMNGMSECHACGRCSGYRDAVELALRRPDSEILSGRTKPATTSEALTLIWGLIGIGTVAMLWRGSAAYAFFHSMMAGWFTPESWLWLHQYGAPWWLLANYPQAHAVLSLFDGLCLLLFLLAGGSALALMVGLPLWLAARLAADPALTWQRLSLSLIPLVGAGLVIGLSALTVRLLLAEGVALPWVPAARMVLLLAGGLFSGWLGWRLLAARLSPRRFLGWMVFLLPTSGLCAIWLLRFA